MFNLNKKIILIVLAVIVGLLLLSVALNSMHNNNIKEEQERQDTSKLSNEEKEYLANYNGSDTVEEDNKSYDEQIYEDYGFNASIL